MSVILFFVLICISSALQAASFSIQEVEQEHPYASIMKGLEQGDKQAADNAYKLDSYERGELVPFLLEKSFVEKPLYEASDCGGNIVIGPDGEYLVAARPNGFFDAYKISKNGIISRVIKDQNHCHYPLPIRLMSLIDRLAGDSVRISFLEDGSYVQFQERGKSYANLWNLNTQTSSNEFFLRGYEIDAFLKAEKMKEAEYAYKVTAEYNEPQGVLDICTLESQEHIRSLPTTGSQGFVAPACSNLIVAYDQVKKRAFFYPFAQADKKQLSNQISLPQAIALIRHAERVRGNIWTLLKLQKSDQEAEDLAKISPEHPLYAFAQSFESTS